MTGSNNELMKLEVIALEKLTAFNKFVNEQAKQKEANNETFDYIAFSTELEKCSPAGIDYHIAVEKLNKYKAENGIA